MLDLQKSNTKMMALLELMNRRYLAQALAGFVGAVRSRKEGERKLAALVQQHDVRCAFAVWRTRAEWKGHQRTLLQRAARRISHLVMAQVSTKTQCHACWQHL